MPEEISIDILYTTIHDPGVTLPGVGPKAPAQRPLISTGSEINVRRRHVAGHRLAAALFREKGLPCSACEMRTLEFGKPYFPSLPAFNISHSNDIVVCATTSYGEIGIDIEAARQLDWEHYRECFLADEWHRISVDYDPCKCLLELWTQKESLLKADGRGLQVPMSSVHLLEGYGMIQNERRRWYITPVHIAGCFCHVSTEYPVRHIVIRKTGNRHRS